MQVQYHLYTPLGPHRENLLAYQRTTHDLFIADSLREDLQRKSEAALQILPSGCSSQNFQLCQTDFIIKIPRYLLASIIFTL